ncbi:MarR family transcriptional regulator [Rubrobacter tropicus]|uniref:MarR family transcriptional regulator n=1 Tax=Rubrobacter tropicus TaxID=2653851 RepID=A0A6G8Q6R9_9ACTN|nr:MarR family transcriptional regulator [Rubrobacter tropicus]QIN82184.1 MarR family transcriptional regulator [Rubrobacter tropicus]
MDTVSSGAVGDLSLRLVDEFAAFGPAYMKWVRSRMREPGVSYARMRLLGALHCGGPKIMSGISDELGVTRRNVTALVDGLEQEGLVRRLPHPTDRRAIVIELTDEGGRTMETQYEEHRKDVAELFVGLSEEDRRELVRLLGLLRERLREEGGCQA